MLFAEEKDRILTMESDKFKQLSMAGYGCVMVLKERALN